MLGTEFGGMNAVLADLYQQTGDARWLTAAQRFDHAAVFNPLASNQDQLNGLHANTQVPKWIGAAREYKATGTTRYRDIAANAWNITVNAHTYVDRRQQPGRALPGPERDRRLPRPTTPASTCNTYNMLKLTRELWLLDPDNGPTTSTSTSGRCSTTSSARRTRPTATGTSPTSPRSSPGGRRGVGPGLGRRHLEHRLQHVLVLPGHRHRDQHQADGLDLLLQRHHADGEPVHAVGADLDASAASRSPRPRRTRSSDTTTLQVTGSVSGSWTMRVRIPAWTSGATISVNGAAQNVATTPGTLRHAHPIVGLRRHRHRPAADAGGRARPPTTTPTSSRSPTVRSCCRATTATPTLSRAAGADRLVGHPHQHHRAGVHRHRQRRHGQPRPVLRRARLQLHRLLERQRRQSTGGTRPSASSTSAAGSCSASRTCPPPTAAWRCSGATTAPPTTTGSSSPTAPRSGSATSTAARCSAWRTCPPPTTPASCSGPTTAPPTTGGRSSTRATAPTRSATSTAASCSPS